MIGRFSRLSAWLELSRRKRKRIAMAAFMTTSESKAGPRPKVFLDPERDLVMVRDRRSPRGCLRARLRTAFWGLHDKILLCHISPALSINNFPKIIAAMEEDVRQSLLPVTRYWRLQHPNGHCQTPDSAIPWLLSLVAICVCYSIFLGASDVRRYIRKTLGGPLDDEPRKIRTNVALVGSFMLYFVMTLITAQVLRAPSTKGPAETKIAYGTALGAWMLRPLPGLLVSITSVMSWSTYHTSAMEMQKVETVLGLGAGYYYIDILKRSQRAITTLQKANSKVSPAPGTWASAVSTSIAPTATVLGNLRETPDRTCGGANQYTCLGSVDGDCCSSFGFCGNNSQYCAPEAGCQPAFGKCTSAKNERRQTVSSDRRCGIGFGNTCDGLTWGGCCSANSYCGSDAAYCGEGCQKGYGECWNTDGSEGSAPAEEEILRLLGGLRGAAILGILVFAASLFSALLFTITGRHRKLIIVAGLIFLSLGRFLAGALLWNFALRLNPGAFCVDKKTISAVTIVWALVPFADHLWRASFGS